MPKRKQSKSQHARKAGAGRRVSTPEAARKKAPERRFRIKLSEATRERLTGYRRGVGRNLHTMAIRLRLRRAAVVESAATTPSVTPGKRVLNEQSAEVKRSINIDGIVAVLLGLLLIYPPFLYGLFYTKEMLPTQMVTAVLFAFYAFYKLTKGKLVFFKRPLDYAVFIMLGLYLTSSINAWDAHSAVLAILKMADYAAVYWLISYAVRSASMVRNYLAVFMAGGAGVALLGIGSLFGSFKLQGAFANGRIISSMQYADGLAAFLAAVNLFGLYVWSGARRLQSKMLCAAGNYLIFLALLGTLSRSAFAVYIIGLLVLIFGLPAQSRRKVAVQFALQLLASLLVFARVMGSSTGAHHQLLGWVWLLCGLVAILAAVLVWDRLEAMLPARAEAVANGAVPRHRTMKPWVAPALTLVLVLVLVSGGYNIWRQQKATPGWVSPLTKASAQDLSIGQRLIMDRDALKVMVSGPAAALLGTGGGGWTATYSQFQSYYYYATDVHNDFLRVGVETGWPGLLAFLAIWACFFAAVARTLKHLKAKKAGDETARARGAIWALTAGALTLGLLSLVEYNLTLSALAILLWAVFGLGRAMESLYGPEADEVVDDRNLNLKDTGVQVYVIVRGLLVSVAALLLLIVSCMIIVGQSHANKAVTASQKQNSTLMMSELQQAINYDPWNVDYSQNMANIIFYTVQQQQQNATLQQDATQQQQNATQLSQAESILSQALKKSRTNPQIHNLYSSILFSEGKFDAGLTSLDAVVTVLPFEASSYENLAQGHQEIGLYLLEQAVPLVGSKDQTQKDQAAQYKQKGLANLQKVMDVPQSLQNKMAGVPAAYRKYWKDAPLLAVSPKLSLSTGESAVVLHKWSEAAGYLKAAEADSTQKPEAQLWEGMALNQQKAGAGNDLIKTALKANPNMSTLQSYVEEVLKLVK